MPEQVSVQQFAAKIRERRPDLANIPDVTLVAKTLAAAPNLKEYVDLTALPGTEKGAFESPKYGPTGPNATEMVSEQAANVLKGIPQAVTGIPAAAKSVFNILKSGLSGNAGQAVSQTGDLVKGALQPFTTTARGVGALAGVSEAPTDEEFATAAQGAGAMLGAAELPNVVSGLKQGAFSAIRGRFSKVPETMMSRAADARALVQDRPAGVPITTTEAVKQAVRPIVNAGASVTENIAKYIAAKRDAGIPIGQMLVPPEEAPITGTPSNVRYAETDSAQRLLRAPYVEPAPAESAPLNIPRPGVPASVQQDLASASRARELSEVAADELRRSRQWQPATEPIGESGPLNIPRPGVSPTVAQDIEAYNATRADVNPAIKRVEESIAPSGTKAKSSALRNVPQLLQEAPELAEIPKGPAFDKALMGRFQRASNIINATEDQIPRTTTVPQQPIADGLASLYEEYQERGLTKAATAVAKEWDRWAKLPDQIPWETFRDMKRGFFKQNNVNSSALRRAYGVLMNASSQVSPELAEANRVYSVFRRGLENAGIDLQTGRRISAVGRMMNKR